jgi:hypothetical protein
VQSTAAALGRLAPERDQLRAELELSIEPAERFYEHITSTPYTVTSTHPNSARKSIRCPAATYLDMFRNNIQTMSQALSS